MPNVTRYQVLFHGSPDGYEAKRAEIILFNDTTTVGNVRFHDPGMPFPNDGMDGNHIVMHLPGYMYENVIDLLRNERPIIYYFGLGRAFLGTAYEPVGEGE